MNATTTGTGEGGAAPLAATRAPPWARPTPPPRAASRSATARRRLAACGHRRAVCPDALARTPAPRAPTTSMTRRSAREREPRQSRDGYGHCPSRWPPSLSPRRIRPQQPARPGCRSYRVTLALRAKGRSGPRRPQGRRGEPLGRPRDGATERQESPRRGRHRSATPRQARHRPPGRRRTPQGRHQQTTARAHDRRVCKPGAQAYALRASRPNPRGAATRAPAHRTLAGPASRSIARPPPS